MNQAIEIALTKEHVLPLLQRLPDLGPMTTIVFSGGCVFEYKGPFPPGRVAEGFYNLEGTRPGFEGHLRLESLARVRFQDRPHRGRASYAFVFEDDGGRTVFKVFLGRDEQGEIYADQLAFFDSMRTNGQLPKDNDHRKNHGQETGQ
jgi:putative heme utilization carrier protein HutX